MLSKSDSVMEISSKCKTVLCVDDDVISLAAMCTYLEELGFEVKEARDGKEALEIIHSQEPDIIISDVEMPRMNGLELLKSLYDSARGIPVIMVSGAYKIQNVIRALQLGAWDFITKENFSKDIFEQTLKKTSERLDFLREKQAYERNLERMVRERTADLERTTKGLLEANENLHAMLVGTITSLVKATETRDPYTSGHMEQVSILATVIADEAGLPEDQVESVKIAALMHDIGKIAIPSMLLTKPIRLDPLEFELIKRHSVIGYDILKDIPFPWPLATIVRQHHERLDGTGYPDKLKGDAILKESQILAIADVVEAMSSHRPYRPALGVDIALDEIHRNSGVLYNPGYVDVCLQVFKNKDERLKIFF